MDVADTDANNASLGAVIDTREPGGTTACCTTYASPLGSIVYDFRQGRS